MTTLVSSALETFSQCKQLAFYRVWCTDHW